MITCILEGMQKNTHIHVSYDKVREITQGADENPAIFLACLTEAVQKYTNLDITTLAGLLYLHIQFISQSAPDIRRKLQQLEKGPETPQRDFLEVAFKVFNNRRRLREKKNMREKLNMPFWQQQLRKEISLAQVIPEQDLRFPPDPASDATNQDTGQRHAQTRRPPTKACLTCGQSGHWKMDCPQGRPCSPREVPTSHTWRVEYSQGHPGAPREIPTSTQNPSPTL